MASGRISFADAVLVLAGRLEVGISNCLSKPKNTFPIHSQILDLADSKRSPDRMHHEQQTQPNLHKKLQTDIDIDYIIHTCAMDRHTIALCIRLSYTLQ